MARGEWKYRHSSEAAGCRARERQQPRPATPPRRGRTAPAPQRRERVSSRQHRHPGKGHPCSSIDRAAVAAFLRGPLRHGPTIWPQHGAPTRHRRRCTECAAPPVLSAADEQLVPSPLGSGEAARRESVFRRARRRRHEPHYRDSSLAVRSAYFSAWSLRATHVPIFLARTGRPLQRR